MDLIGQINDFCMQKKNREPNNNGNPIWEEKFFLSKLQHDNIQPEWDKGIPQCVLELSDFKKDGEFFSKVSNRLNSAADKVTEARKMRDMLLAHLDQNSKDESETSSVSAINTATNEFISAWENATNADERNAAIEKFTAYYSKQVAQLMGNFYNEVSGIKIALGRHTVHPDSFASVVVGTMFSSAEILQRSFGMMEQMNLLDDVYQLAKKN